MSKKVFFSIVLGLSAVGVLSYLKFKFQPLTKSTDQDCPAATESYPIARMCAYERGGHVTVSVGPYCVPSSVGVACEGPSVHQIDSRSWKLTGKTMKAPKPDLSQDQTADCNGARMEISLGNLSSGIEYEVQADEMTLRFSLPIRLEICAEAPRQSPSY